MIDENLRSARAVRVGAAVLLLCGAAAIGYVAVQHSPVGRDSGAAKSATPGQYGLPVRQVVGGDPYFDGQEMTLDEAEKTFLANTGEPLPLPSGGVASMNSVAEVWYHATKSDNGTIDYGVALVYVDENFLIQYQLPGASLAEDPAATYQQLYDSLGSKANTLTAVDGVPVFIEPRNTSPQGNPGSLDMVVGAVRVVTIGDLSNDDLVGIAQSIIASSRASS
jgi:hypothetical protein